MYTMQHRSRLLANWKCPASVRAVYKGCLLGREYSIRYSLELLDTIRITVKNMVSYMLLDPNLCNVRIPTAVRTVVRSENAESVDKINSPSEETWCRRWRNISQRSLSTGSSSFSPSLSPILCKHRHQTDVKEHKESKDSKDEKDLKHHEKESKESKGEKESKHEKESKAKSESKSSKHMKSSAVQTGSEEESTDVTVVYHRGLPRITLPLPSRKERCRFTLKPIAHTVGDFLKMVRAEDPAVLSATITSIDNVIIGSSNTIESILEEDFNLVINDVVYAVKPPLLVIPPALESVQQLSEMQCLVMQLYNTFNAREHQAELERQLMMQLEDVKLELEPLELQRMNIEIAAERRATVQAWAGLVLMSAQFGVLARLTWWEYSWDIMEPVTYFVTYGTAMAGYIYWLLTRQEYVMPDVITRQYLAVLHKRARKLNFDLDRYNLLKEEAYELETALKIVRGPLHAHQTLIEQKRRERMANRSPTSSSSSSSRSRSRSPSPSPSPDREIPKKSPASASTVIPN